MAEIAASELTSIIYESPLRLVKTLSQLAEVCGPERPTSVSREISKIHEETRRGTLSELISYFSENNPRGEIVIVLSGVEAPAAHRSHKNKYRSSTDDQVTADIEED